MANCTWRQHARPIIYRVIQENLGKQEKEIRRALRDAYHMGKESITPTKCGAMRLISN
jgi:hypothetical protein